MPKYIDISTRNIPPITYDSVYNSTTVGGHLATDGLLTAGLGLSVNREPIYLNSFSDANNVIKYSSSLNGVSIQGYGGGKMGTTGGLSDVINWNTNSASIVGNFNVYGNKNITGNIALNSEKRIFFKGSSDPNHYIGYDTSSNSVLLQTFGSGKIGTTDTNGRNDIITWNTTVTTSPTFVVHNVGINGNTTMKGNLSLSGSLVVGATTITNASLGYVSGATSNIQNQLDAMVMSSGASLSGTNVFTGTNAYNTNLPTSTLTPTTSTQLTTKAYVDSISGGGITLAGTNAFTGTNTFNTNLPTSTVTPTTATQLTTKTYVDTQMMGVPYLSTTNAFTGTNTFNTNLPTSTVTPTTATQLTTKTYVDSLVTGMFYTSSNNTTSFSSNIAINTGKRIYFNGNADPNHYVGYDTPSNSLLLQTFGSGKIGTTDTNGRNDIITWNTTVTTSPTFVVHNVGINGNTAMTGNLSLSGSLVAGATTITNASLGCVSGATTNLQGQLNKLSINSMNGVTTGVNNHSLGTSCLQALTTGSNNIAIGVQVANQLVSGSYNVALGFQAGAGNGDENVCIGRNAITSGAYNTSVCIGKNSTITASNQIVLGTNAETVKILGTLNVSGVSTLGTLVCNQIYESTQATTGTTSPFTCDMALGSTFYIPTDYTFASNFQIIITNVPTDTSKTYTISVIYRQPTTLFYSNTARVSDTASTYLLGTASTYSAPLFNGGVPVLANSPNLIIQSFSILSLATSTNTFSRFITSSVNNHY